RVDGPPRRFAQSCLGDVSSASDRVSGEEREVIFEITRIGDAQRVAAVDIATGIEVVVQAPANAALADVRALALRKLKRALGSDDDGAGDSGPGSDGRPGKLI
ncbi:MAG: hypothetical protein ABL871_10790, partial [Terricaulis sp.]